MAAAMRQAAADPNGRFVRERGDIESGLRSLHSRFARKNHPPVAVKRPAHVVYFRLLEDGSVLIVRILHERMDPARHLASGDG